MSGLSQSIARTDWIEAAFGAGTTALSGLVTWAVAGDAFIGMTISMVVMLIMGAVSKMEGGETGA